MQTSSSQSSANISVEEDLFRDLRLPVAVVGDLKTTSELFCSRVRELSANLPADNIRKTADYMRNLINEWPAEAVASALAKIGYNWPEVPTSNLFRQISREYVGDHLDQLWEYGRTNLEGKEIRSIVLAESALHFVGPYKKQQLERTHAKLQEDFLGCTNDEFWGMLAQCMRTFSSFEILAVNICCRICEKIEAKQIGPMLPSNPPQKIE